MSSQNTPIQRSRNIPSQGDSEQDLFSEFERLSNADNIDEVEIEGNSPSRSSHRHSSRGDSFGNHPQNISRDKIIRLYRSIDTQNPADEKELLHILNDALKDLRDGNTQDAFNAYQEVSQQIAEESSRTSPSNSEEENTENSNPSPSRSENGTNIYDGMSTRHYEFHTHYSDSVRRNQIISNGGIIQLHAFSTQDTVNVRKISEGNYEIEFHKNGSSRASDTVSYIISGPPSRIILHALPQNISGVSEDDGIIQAGTGPNAASAIHWPNSSSELTSKVPPSGEGASEARALLEKITDAVQANSTGKWSEAINYLNSLWPSSSGRNPSIIGGPALRKALTAIYKYVGNNDAKFKQLMMKIDPQLRREMARCLHYFSTNPNPYDHTMLNFANNIIFHRNDTSRNDASFFGAGALQDGDAKTNEGFENLLNQVPQTQLANNNPEGGNEGENN